MTAWHELKPGDTIGAYRLVRQLGEGGMGTVFQADDTSLDRQVAIKFFNLALLREEPQAVIQAFKQRFIREARLAALVEHPNVVQVLHASMEDPCPHFVMEYLEGATLDTILARRKKLDLPRVCHYGLQIGGALRFAWDEYQIIHRDLKPLNVMILANDLVKLLDLGIAKIVDATHTGAQLTTMGMQVGSPYYMAPEQQTGEVRLDHRCDIFALGIILCQMLTHRAPFVGENGYELHASKMQGVQFRIERVAPQAPVALVDMIYRMLEPDREERLDSYQEIEDVLSECLEAVPGCESFLDAYHKLPRSSKAIPDVLADEEDGEPSRQWQYVSRHQRPGTIDESQITRLSLATSPVGPLEPGQLTPSGIIIEDIPAFLPQMRQLLQQVRPNMRLGPYHVLEMIGFGGMGAVFRGIHLPTDEQVAMKFLIGDDQADVAERVRQFQQEAQIIRRLSHPSIVKVQDLRREQGLSFMVMDLFLGLYDHPVNLRDYCSSFGTASGLLDEEDMQQIMAALLEAVGYAHANGVVHCDLKPENVLFQCMGTDEDGYWDAHLKLTDFGLAKIVGEELVLNSATRSMRSFAGHDDAPQDAAALMGTYDYMSPEQRRGEPASAASDLFSIGMMMLRLLTGVSELGLRGRPTTVRPSIHPDWDDIILTALREDPAERFAAADEMIDAILAIDLQE